MKKIFILAVFVLTSLAGFSKNYTAPSTYFSLDSWKLESPTGGNIINLNGYSSKYFYLTEDNLMCFDIDTNNTTTKTLHDELRHLNNWYVTANHGLSATIKVNASPQNYRLVIAQIYGINDKNEDTAPLLKVTLESGELYAYIKDETLNNERILLKTNVADNLFKLKVTMDNGKLCVSADDETPVERDVNFWYYKNYFKIGAYPQAKLGSFSVYVSELSVY